MNQSADSKIFANLVHGMVRVEGKGEGVELLLGFEEFAKRGSKEAICVTLKHMCDLDHPLDR